MTDIWQALRDHQTKVADRSILSLFEIPSRSSTFSARLGDLLFDYSKTNLDAPTMGLLLDFCAASDLAVKRDAMFEGVAINETEGRAVLHTALRAPKGSVVKVGGENVIPPGWLFLLTTSAKGASQVKAGALRMWSISGSEGLTLALLWRRWHWHLTTMAHGCITSLTLTARILRTLCKG
jgi:glucose-6-phosphate isomerase